MSADLLRRAAAHIRDTAQTATAGPWEPSGSAVGTAWSGAADWSGPIDDRVKVADTAPEDAVHIALWSPDVALLVADYLDSFNEDLADEVAVNEGDCDCSNCVFAWKLAHRILGEDS